MWSNLPFDLLANIFSYLPPDSFALARAACRNWHTAAETAPTLAVTHRHPPWFVALPVHSRGLFCYAHNPFDGNWLVLSLHHPIRPIATTIGGMIVSKITTTTSFQLAVCNVFTNQFKALPSLNLARTNPALGIVDNNSNQKLGFKIYVAGGMCEAARTGGAVYEPTVEMYDSGSEKWTVVGPMPVEFAVRLTVWTPKESVHSNGTLYWMTSARAYSIMGFQISTKRWKELSVPMAERLDFAALVARNGKLAVVGGGGGGGAWIWELEEDEVWNLVMEVPFELGSKLLGEKPNWASVKCVGIDGAVCLYRDLGSGIIVCREILDEGKWEWDWIEGCCSIRGSRIQNFPIKGLLIKPNLAHSTF